jgi:hypothetical protein
MQSTTFSEIKWALKKCTNRQSKTCLLESSPKIVQKRNISTAKINMQNKIVDGSASRLHARPKLWYFMIQFNDNSNFPILFKLVYKSSSIATQLQIVSALQDCLDFLPRRINVDWFTLRKENRLLILFFQRITIKKLTRHRHTETGVKRNVISKKILVSRRPLVLINLIA